MSTPDHNTGTHTSLINIGTHNLSFTLSGPPRQPSQPLMVIMHGLTSTMTEWPAVRRLLSPHCRVLDYDRSGLGRSEPSPNPPTAETIAAELNALLSKLNLPPPYVTIAHSWGGVTSMEFLASRSAGDVAGMVFVDAGAPSFFKVMPIMWADASVKAVNGEGEETNAEAWKRAFNEITGMSKATVLSKEDWDAYMAEEGNEGHKKQAGLEIGEFAGTYDTLAKKGLLEREEKVLGKGPVCVVRGGTDRDFEKMYQWGVGKGNGTVKQRKEYRAILDGWEEKDVVMQKDFFKLTAGKTRFTQAPKSGHNVQLTEPEVIVEAVKWVMDNL